VIKNYKVRNILNEKKFLINKGLTIVELLISMAVVGVILSILIYIIISLNKDNQKKEQLVDNLRIAYIIGNKIKSASLTRDIFISKINNNKYLILAKSPNNNSNNIEFHLYQEINSDNYYYVKYSSDIRVVKYKIPKYVQYKIQVSNNFYEVIFYVYEKYSKTNSQKIAYYMLLPKN
jgi:prepilin-type N-terminal cleavage/methylation domain-containing protein